MVGRTSDVFVWDDFRLDLDRYRLERAGDVLALEPKALDLLTLLVSRPGHLFGKQEIFDTLWPDTAVTDSALTRVIAQLRRVLADDPRDPRFIETVPTRGYRWKCPVTVEPRLEATVEVASNGPAPPHAMAATFGGTDSPADTTSDLAASDVVARPVATVASPPLVNGVAHQQPPTGRVNVSLAAGAAIAFVLVAVAAWMNSRLVQLQDMVATDTAAVHVPWPVQVTTHPGLDMGPAFSPRGDALAFTSDRSGALEIYVRSLGEGGTESALTADGGQNVQPAWSPDGMQMAYHSNKSGGIWVMPARGGVARQVAAEGSRPAWSPDGLRIAYQSDEHVDVTPSAFGASAGSTIRIVRRGRHRRASADVERSSARWPCLAGVEPRRPVHRLYRVRRRTRERRLDRRRQHGPASRSLNRARVSTRWCLRRTAARSTWRAAKRSSTACRSIRGTACGADRPSPSRCRACRVYVGCRSPPTARVSASPASLSTARSGRSRFAPTARRGARPPRSPETSAAGPRWPSISPDGSRIAYMSSRKGDPPNVWVMDRRRRPQGAGDVERRRGR